MSVCDQPLMPGEGGARWHWTPARVEVAVLAWSRAAKQLWLVLVRVLLLGEAETPPLLGSVMRGVVILGSSHLCSATTHWTRPQGCPLRPHSRPGEGMVTTDTCWWWTRVDTCGQVTQHGGRHARRPRHAGDGARPRQLGPRGARQQLTRAALPRPVGTRGLASTQGHTLMGAPVRG